LVIGVLVTWLSLEPFIVTLGMWGAIRGTARGIAHETEIGAPITWVNNILSQLPADQKWMIFPAGVWIMILLTLFVGATMRYSRFGRHVFAIGSNVQTARLCGVRVSRTKILMYLFASFFAGIAGVLHFSKLSIGDATSTPSYELNIIAAVVIGGTSLLGGKGGVTGTLIGALLMTVVANGCSKVGMDNWLQEIVTGGMIVLAAVLDRFRQRRPQ
jgi:ribose/xylose/arabinose/galactoside ABC-type transport system permease subunit